MDLAIANPKPDSFPLLDVSPRKDVRWDAAAIITDARGQTSIELLRFETDFATLRRVPQRIADEVPQYLFHASWADWIRFPQLRKFDFVRLDVDRLQPHDLDPIRNFI